MVSVTNVITPKCSSKLKVAIRRPLLYIFVVLTLFKLKNTVFVSPNAKEKLFAV